MRASRRLRLASDASLTRRRSIALYDVRADTPLRKLVMLKRANKVAWNPREAFNFTVASEDNNLYSFDMRKLDIATNVHKDFVSVRSEHGLLRLPRLQVLTPPANA